MYTANPQKKQPNFDSIYNAIFNAIPGNAVVVDRDGQIAKTNVNWNKFAIENGLNASKDWIGQNYLEVCKKLTSISNESAGEACKAIKAILNGEEADFELDYQGQKPGESQWYRMQATGFEFEGSFFATIIHKDITEKSELDFHLLANSSPGVIYRCTLDDPWEMHFISDKIEILSGYPKEDFLGLDPIRPFGEIMHSDDREEASRLVQIAIDKKEAYKLAYRVIHKDGHINYVFGYGQATYKSDGSPDYLVGVIFNDTDRVLAVKKVKESEENYRTLIEQANDGIVVIQDAKVIFANSALTRITGYSVEELTGSDFIDFIPEKELDKVKANYVKRMNGEHLAAYESKIVHKNGSVIDVEFNGRLTHYKGKVADLATVRDISEAKKAEEERNRLFNLSSDLIGIAGFDGIFKQINPAWEDTLGYSIEELTEKPFFDFIHPDDHHKTNTEMERLAKGRTTIDFENRYLHKNGSIIHVFWAATPVPEQGVVYCIGRDITERKKVETQILQYQRRLKDQAIELTLSEEKQRKEIAVDLHDQVGQLLAYSRMQLAALTPNLPKDEILDKIRDISKGLLSAIETTRSVIFDLSPPQLEELGLFAAIGDWMEEEIEQHTDIQTSISGDEQLYPLNENVRILLFRCVRELLINTLKHAGATKLNVHIEYRKTDLQIVVRDNGIGFNYQPEQLKLRQSGFGLFSVFERISDLGGEMEIKTSLGKGTHIQLNISTIQRET